MKFTPRYTTFCMLLISVCLCGPASAELALNFSNNDGASFSSDFDVLTGDSLNIGVYLQETGGGTILTDQGLGNWGFDLIQSTTDFGTVASRSVDASDFEVEIHNVTTATGFEWEYLTTDFAGVRGDSILLGSFEFESTADGFTVFTIEDRIIGSDLGAANWSTATLGMLDQQIFGPGAAETFQFSVNATSAAAVPEPSSFAVLSVVAGLVMVRRQRRA